jgi:predicted HTH transcriptional regulator
MSQSGRTSLSEEQYRTGCASARRVIQREGRVSNRSLREESGLNYDQVIKLFAFAVTEGLLVRYGKAGGTHYKLGDVS